MAQEVSTAKDVNLATSRKVADPQRSASLAANIWRGALTAQNQRSVSIAKVVMSSFSEHAQEVGFD